MNEAFTEFYNEHSREPIPFLSREWEVEKIIARKFHPATKSTEAEVSYLPIFKMWSNLTFNE